MNEKWKRALITAGCVALGSQISLNFLMEGFIIALAVVVLGVLMYKYNLLDPIRTGILVGIVSPLFRATVLVLRSNLPDFASRCKLAWTWTYPEIGFYITYGLCFYLFYKNPYIKRNIKNYFFCMVFCDFTSNIVETFIRSGHMASKEQITSLAILALCRATFICCLLICFQIFQSLLSREEHEDRYKKMLIMASVFRSEIYFMNKNMVEIENIVKNTFKMYQTINNGNYPQELSVMSLDIAKDVHEIKKDYIRVIQGLQKTFLSNISEDQMEIGDITNILSSDIHEQIEEQNYSIQFLSGIKTSFMVRDHFSLMSILRNLVLNSVDAIADSRKDGVIRLLIEKNRLENTYEFRISDNGKGISPKDIEMIFDAGYSTKFDEETGDINRGMGLTLVRDLTQEKFKGKVEVESTLGQGTTFIIKIPCESMQK